MVERFLGDRVTLHAGDCREVLAQLEENSIDSCVTDPPYHLLSIVKRFGAEDAMPPKLRFPYGCNFKGSDAPGGGTGAAFARMSRGFMGKVWDGGDVAFDPETWRAVYRVLKPGAHFLAMGGTRTFHRLACAIEDAGFEVRDTISWLYGSGFPKSHDVSKAIDRAAGADDQNGRQYLPDTAAARQWDGWGTALKPACELIVLARKPLSEGTVAANVLRWGTGAINVDGCRVAASDADKAIIAEGVGRMRNSVRGDPGGAKHEGWARPWMDDTERLRASMPDPHAQGRWPANVVHDGSEEVVAGFPETVSGARNGPSSANEDRIFKLHRGPCEGDSGSAARFFYTAKADADDRLGSKHPTVKPLDLMQYLVRLVTPPRGLVLDPFAGTGTTGEAAWREGMSAVLIEAEVEYQADLRRRMALALAGPDERAREAIKARNLPRDDGPLFAARETYDATDDFARSIDEAYRVIRERKANGGPGWGGWE